MKHLPKQKDLKKEKAEKRSKQKNASSQKDKFRWGFFFLSFAITIALFAGAFLLASPYLKGYLAKLREGNDDTDQSQVSYSSVPTEQTLLAESSKAPESYLDDAVFIGDSRTNGMEKYGFIKAKNNFSKDGMSHQNALTEKIVTLGGGSKATIPTAIGERRPDVMYVSFGINGISYLDEESFFSSYAELIDALKQKSSKSAVVIQSILPVSASKEKSDPRMLNSIIDYYNHKLLKLAEEKGVYFLDSSSVLKDSNNKLAAKYDSGDGLHYNQAAYEALMDFILRHPVPSLVQ